MLCCQQVILPVADKPMVFHRQRGLVRLYITAVTVTADHNDTLHITAAVQQILAVQHVITGLVFFVHRSGIKRVEDIHGGEQQAVAPADRLAAEADHDLVTDIACSETVEAQQQGAFTLVMQIMRQVKPAPVIVDNG